MAVALLLPMTYAMSPTVALIMLMGIYIGANYGGSITAVAINTPGTPSATVTAFDGYPMLNAKAMTVASRAIPEGMEYLFTAKDMPREDNPKMPPAGELKVYVTVEKDAKPVFTKVVR